MDRVLAEALIFQFTENGNHSEALPVENFQRRKKCKKGDDYLKYDRALPLEVFYYIKVC